MARSFPPHLPRRKQSRRLFECLEPRQLLSATFLDAFGIGTASPYGQSITGMATDSAGDIVVAGIFQGTMDVDPTAGVHTITSQGTLNYDLFLAKYHADGTLVWAKALSGPGNDMSGGIYVDGSDNIVLTGSFSGTLDADPGAGVTNLVSNGGADALLAKYDGDGNLLWAKSFGGTGDDNLNPTKITSDHNGGYILMGTFQETADLDPGAGVHNATASTLWDAYVSRVDGNGNLIWADTFTAPGTLFMANVAVDNGGNVYTAGFFQGQFDINPGAGTKMLGHGDDMLGFVAKFAAGGKLAWAQQFGEGAAGVLVADFALDVQKNLVIVGSFGGSGDFNPGAGVKTLTEHQTPDAFTGFVMKLSSTGVFKWAGAQTGDSWSDAFAVTTDAAGNIYVTGENNGTNTFDITGSGNDTLTSRGQDDAYLAKYDPAGHVAWIEPMGSVGYDHGLHLELGPGNRIYCGGYFNSTAHFGPADAGVDLSAVGEMDSFIAVFDQVVATPAITLEASQIAPSTLHAATFRVSVAPAQGVATGRVVIREGSRILATLTLDGAGHAVLGRLGLRKGTHNVTVSYLGDANFGMITSSVVVLNIV